jgi:hypothetical protein
MSVVDVPLQLGYIHIRLNNKYYPVVLASHVILALTIRSGVVSCIFFAFAYQRGIDRGCLDCAVNEQRRERWFCSVYLYDKEEGRLIRGLLMIIRVGLGHAIYRV